MERTPRDQETRILPRIAAEEHTSPLPPRRALYEQPPEPRRRRAPLLPLAVVGLILLAAVGIGGFLLLDRGEVMAGLQVAGVDLGGLQQAEAEARLAERLTTYSNAPLVLQMGDRRWEIAPRDLGVRYDIKATMREVDRRGGSVPLITQVGSRLPGEKQVVDLQPVGTIDQAALVAGLAPVLSELNRPAANAQVVVTPDKGLSIAPAAAGQQVDLAAVSQALRDRALTLSTEPVALTTRAVPPTITEAELAPVQQAAADLLGQPITLSLPREDAAKLSGLPADGWRLSPAELNAMLMLGGPDRRSLVLEESRLTARVSALANQINRPSAAAELKIDAKGVVAIAPHAYGVVIDVPATVQAINAAVAAGRHEATLQATIETPKTLSDDLTPVKANLDKILGRSLTITGPDVEETLKRPDLARFLEIEARPDSAEKAVVTVDRQAVSDYLATLARKIDRDPRAPVFKYLDGQVKQVSEGVAGRSLKTTEAADALSTALLSAGAASLKLPITVIEAPMQNVNPSDIVIRDVLGQGSTYYGFSIPDRKHNVELATQRLNGTLIPPGEVFSFNRSVGPARLETGFKTGYGIVLTNGAVQTVPSVGGGICQVATTVFHAAYHAGVEIGQRSWHLYWIPSYGQAPSGMTGLDATVDDVYGLDFTFRNTTGNWMALETSYDGQNIYMTLRGVDPGWEVRTDGPHVTNVKKADPTPVTREDPTMPKGQRLQVESARDGMDVSITRTVLSGGQVIDQETFNSHYEPSQNVTLVGTGGA